MVAQSRGVRVEDGQVHEPAGARVLSRLERPDRELVLLRVERRRNHEHGVCVLQRLTDGVRLLQVGLDDVVRAQGSHSFPPVRAVHHGPGPEWSSQRSLQHIRTAESGRADHRDQGRLLAAYGL